MSIVVVSQGAGRALNGVSRSRLNVMRVRLMGCTGDLLLAIPISEGIDVTEVDIQVPEEAVA